MNDSKVSGDDRLKLAPREYRLVVAPALAAAAETAAERGDPQLFNDMASMLALSWMVDGLAGHYQAAVPREDWDSDPRAFEAAPLGACALVFTESDLDESQVSECIGALGQASQMLQADELHQQGRQALDKAWQQLIDEQHDDAIESLRDCAKTLAQAVDDWESSRQR